MACKREGAREGSGGATTVHSGSAEKPSAASGRRKGRQDDPRGSVAQQQTLAESRRFGTYLRKMREERRLSLDAVEEMSLGLSERVTKSHLSRIENGQAVPSFPRMFALSQIYGIPVSSMAERFELCLKSKMCPAGVAKKSIQEVVDEAQKLCVGGRHAEALLLYESLLERLAKTHPPDEARWNVELRLDSINCLKKLSRLATAKEESERLLTLTDLEPRQEIRALQFFAMCCYGLGKYTVALMAIEKAEQKLAKMEGVEDLSAAITVLKGNLHYITHRYAEAAEAFRAARAQYQDLADVFEACLAQLNLAATLIETGAVEEARAQLTSALATTEQGGYDRLRALALSHLALASYRSSDLEATEAYCLRSNRVARPREYVSILFRNCFYLWRIAQSRQDEVGIKTNERTLRTYLNRIEAYVPEAEEFRATLGGGNHE